VHAEELIPDWLRAPTETSETSSWAPVTDSLGTSESPVDPLPLNQATELPDWLRDSMEQEGERQTENAGVKEEKKKTPKKKPVWATKVASPKKKQETKSENSQNDIPDWLK
jgi:hypothetical protein